MKSLAYAGFTTLCCVFLAYPVAWTIARSQAKWRNLLLLLVILPFWSNFLIRVYAWMMLLGTQSGLNKSLTWLLALFGRDANTPVQLLYTPFAVLIALVYVHLPFMVLPLYANLEKHEMALLDAAQDLGANVWQRFWRITFPLSLPGIYAGAALVFIPALGMFAIPDLLGGTDSTLIANEIKQMFLDRRDWPTGSALSMLMTLAVLLLLCAVVLMVRFKTKQPRG
jgi:spermidine/putrescine transport system permease protein